jgi:GNAT superfamily N-acetyltransferase
MTVEIVRYRPEHKAPLARLLVPLWCADVERNAAYLTWKYEKNPYASEPHLWLALEGETVVGVRGLSGARWTAGNVFHSDDLFVAPSHRSGGIPRSISATLVADAEREGLGPLLSLTPSPVTTLVSLAAGFRVVGTKAPVRRLGPRVAARKALRERVARMPLLWRLKGLLRTPEERRPFDALDRSRPNHAVGGLVVEDAPRPSAMAAMAERSTVDDRARHVRDAAYFEWRLSCPLADHRYLLACGPDGLDGYLILERRLGPSGDGAVTIADWEAPDPAVRENLLRAALHWGRFGEITTWSATLSDETRAILARAGFRSVTEGGELARYRSCVLARGAESVLPRELSRWDLRPLWSA